MLTARLYGIVAKPLALGVGPHLRFNVRRLRGLFGGLFGGLFWGVGRALVSLPDWIERDLALCTGLSV